MQTPTQFANQSFRRSITKYSIFRTSLWADASEEQIVHASKVGIVLILRKAKGQVPIQGYCVQVILQHVQLPYHYVTQRHLPVRFQVRPQEIRLPICQIEASLPLKYQVNETLHRPSNRHKV